jgi:hypothetical protein
VDRKRLEQELAEAKRKLDAVISTSNDPGRAARVCDPLHSVGALVVPGMRRHAARLDRQRKSQSNDIGQRCKSQLAAVQRRAASGS